MGGGEGGQEGRGMATGKGRCGEAIGTGREWQWGGGQREEEMERGAVGKGATGRRER